jgi:hypothetical protein
MEARGIDMTNAGDTAWIAQHDAKAGEALKIVGQNANGTANLSRACSVAAEDVSAGDRLLMLDESHSSFIRDC